MCCFSLTPKHKSLKYHKHYIEYGESFSLTPKHKSLKYCEDLYVHQGSFSLTPKHKSLKCEFKALNLDDSFSLTPKHKSLKYRLSNSNNYKELESLSLFINIENKKLFVTFSCLSFSMFIMFYHRELLISKANHIDFPFIRNIRNYSVHY